MRVAISDLEGHFGFLIRRLFSLLKFHRLWKLVVTALFPDKRKQHVTKALLKARKSFLLGTDIKIDERGYGSLMLLHRETNGNARGGTTLLQLLNEKKKELKRLEEASRSPTDAKLEEVLEGHRRVRK